MIWKCSVTCPQAELAVGASMTCVLTGTATAGSYANTAVVTGTPTLGPVTPITDTNPSHYYGVTAGIGDRIWYDDNYNGIQDGGETGVMSVTVELLDSSDTVIRTTTTDASGYYSFTNLAPTVYGIRFVTSTLPAGYIITLRDVGSDNAADSDADPVTGRTLDTLLTNGEYDPDWDLGIFLPQPTIAVEKYTSSAGSLPDDADTPPGPTLAVGDVVTWTYVITNTGNITLTDILLVDDREGSVSCPATTLAPNGSVTCVLTGTATTGLYSNTVVVTGTPTITGATPVTDTDPSHYTGLTAGIGDRIWYDDNGNGLQDLGEGGVSGVTVELRNSSGDVISTTSTSATGYYSFTNLAADIYSIRFVSSTLPSGYLFTQQDANNNSNNAGDSDADPMTGETINTLLVGNEYDPDWDAGIWLPQPSITVEKATSSAGSLPADADLAPGPVLAVGETVTWTYEITNIGNVTLTNIVLADDVEGSIVCPEIELAPGTGMTCVLTGTTTAGQYANTAIVTGTPTLGSPLGAVTDTNSSHYYGGDPGIQLIKYTNGYNADDPTGPYIGVGDVVTWTYVITNTGNQTLSNITLEDSVEGPVTCPVSTLVAGASTTCVVTGTASAGQYMNTAVVSGTTPGGSVLNFTNPSHYFGVNPDIQLIKYTNGEDADTIPGPSIAEGEMVTWSYVITNTGNVALTDITLSDDVEGEIICPATDLAVGAGMTCEWFGIAIGGQYTNTAIVTGTPDIPTNPSPDLPSVPTTPTPTEPVTDTNPSHYFGQSPVFIGDYLWIEDDNDGDATTGNVTPVAGQVVTATSSSGAIYTDITDASGFYLILVPANDTYTVTTGISADVVDAPVVLNASNDENHDRLGTAVVMTTTDNLTIDFGYYLAAQFGDRVWIESDSDGDVATGTVIPVAGMVITATDGVNEYTAVTDAAGYYSFTVPGGAYLVTYGEVPAAYGTVTPSAAPGGDSESGNGGAYQDNADQSHENGTFVIVAGGEANWQVDFAFNAPMVLIGDRLWIEDDNDGDAGTGNVTPVVGQVVTATATSGAVYTAMTDANGRYTITVPANATYTVTTDLPTGGVVDTPVLVTDGSNPASDNDRNHDRTGTTVVVTLTDNLSIDFGFFQPTPMIAVVKYTSSAGSLPADADTPPGPTVALGSVVTWTYVITNTGNVTLTDVTLTDDVEGSVTCPATELAVGAGMTCVLTGTATAGQYANTAIVTGTPTLGSPLEAVTDTNSSHYYGGDPGIQLIKYTNGYNADDPTGPYIGVGDVVTWTMSLRTRATRP
ncbi:MAG: SdrD B-like domain-containing protein [Caldilineaceae bacterium]